MKRPEARELGIPIYYNVPCKKGHTSGRYTSNGSCTACVRQFATDNPEVNRLAVTKYLKANPDKPKRVCIRWRKANPDKVRNQRYVRRCAEGRFTPADITEIRTNQDDLCNICKIGLNGSGQIDHIQPISKGGTNWPANLQLLCKPCNQKKSNKWPWP